MKISKLKRPWINHGLNYTCTLPQKTKAVKAPHITLDFLPQPTSLKYNYLVLVGFQFKNYVRGQVLAPWPCPSNQRSAKQKSSAQSG